MPPIVVIAGQSNAAGRGSLPSVPAALGYGTAYAPVQHMYRVEDAPNGLNAFAWDFDVGPEDLTYIDSGNGTFGVELSLGRKLHRAGYEHAIVKMAIGSTSLGVHWKALNSTYPSSGDKLFTQFIDYLGEAETALEGEIAELIWIQGEADAANSTHAGNYAANLREFIEEFREVFPGTPITLNRLHADCSQTHTATVRAAQTSFAAAVPGVRIVHADDLALPDGSHYSSPAYVTLGERFADALLGGGPAVGIRAGWGCP